ncbi:hypothetical protein [Dysgonomonas sp. PH5-45]|nr:hypothetical protein [Dysgonomonas sp. PH5-45]
MKIKNCFDKYGKQKGSVMVQLSSDILSQGSKISFYKSLVLDETPEKLTTVLQAVHTDIEKGSKISELKKNGKVESGTYLVRDGKKTQAYEYILFKNKSKKITLVYLKGSFSPQQLDYELSKLKDLFIYVNNKRLKIQ